MAGVVHTAYERQAYLNKLLAAVKENVEDLALIVCAENGEPLPEAQGEVGYGARFLEWFAAESVR
jgi:succinate-semialdehyde dehydrogenase/glutarate-semialdehyde dehydrogenase